jgi:hypothetical protein
MKVHLVTKGAYPIKGKNHLARIYDFGKWDKLKKIYMVGEKTPPVKIWFIANETDPPKKKSERNYGHTGNFLTKYDTCFIYYEQHIDNGKFNIKNCGLTVAHELSHTLLPGKGHPCDKRKPGLMCTYGENKIHPQLYLQPKLVEEARKSPNLTLLY